MPDLTTRALIKELVNNGNISGKVLDLGCGRGKYRAIIEQFGNEYVGVDKYESKNTSFLCDAWETPFEDNHFDTVVCTQVIEHTLEPQKVIDECYRILKPGGKLVLTAPWEYPFHPEPNDYFRFSKEALEYMVGKSGFKKFELTSRGGRFRVISGFVKVWMGNKYLIRGFEILDDIFFKKNNSLNTPNHCVIAQK